jgi:hypothetical protein
MEYRDQTQPLMQAAYIVYVIPMTELMVICPQLSLRAAVAIAIISF